MRIVVTGGSGKLGRAVVAELESRGHAVWVFDRAAPRSASNVIVDLTDHGAVADALAGLEDRYDGVDALVHLAAIPAPGIVPDAATFRNNMLGSYAVLQGARRAGIRRIVAASSETLLGLPFDEHPPYFPVDALVTSPNSTYSLVKLLEETMAGEFARWDPELSFTSLRFSNVLDPTDYATFESFQDDPLVRKWNAWGYIDSRDGATAVAQALETRGPGWAKYVIAAADTVMRRPSAELAAEVFPDVPFRREVPGRETLLDISAAVADLQWRPVHSWLD